MKWLLPIVLLCGTCAAWAHHSWAGYDQTKVIDFAAVILESSYANPHGWMRLKDGNKEWLVVLPPPSQMAARGLTREMIEAGEQVRVVGHPHRSEPNEMRAARITSGGKTVDLK